MMKTGTRIKDVDGKKVSETFTYPELTYSTVTKKIPANRMRLGTIDGKAVEMSQGVGKVVIETTEADGVDPAYKPLFAEWTLVLTILPENK
ncbi:hypothetical protein FRUB_07788 [Fimbriiglobus ruber]|uniref:Uncharacterized protein n=1 Tax=Fimbriiglobus ruber TaxID=1908690 RepID=A0A225DJ99_9BACT|nr:hypothetical protein FRUB_07788 [Fimbriiglobus ruber]